LASYQQRRRFYTKAADAFGIDKADLKSMAHIDELQINIGNGNFAVADNVWSKQVKVIENGVEKTEIHVYINETKLSEGTLPTKRQGELFSAAPSSTNITSRSVKDDITPIIPKDAKIIAKGIIKTNGNGSVSDFYNITKIY
jgi:aspartyl-tRNA synthetase